MPKRGSVRMEQLSLLLGKAARSSTTSIKRITENIKFLNLASGVLSRRSSSVHLPITFRFGLSSCIDVLFSISVECEASVEAPAFPSFRFHSFPINWPLVKALSDDYYYYSVNRGTEKVFPYLRRFISALHSGFQ